MGKGSNTLMILAGGALLAYVVMPEKVRETVRAGGSAIPNINLDLSGLISGLTSSSEFPDIKLPDINIPEGGYTIPSIPDFNMPDLPLPTLPDLGIPDLPWPKLPEAFIPGFPEAPQDTPTPWEWFTNLNPVIQNVIAGVTTVVGGYATVKAIQTITPAINPVVKASGNVLARRISQFQVNKPPVPTGRIPLRPPGANPRLWKAWMTKGTNLYTIPAFLAVALQDFIFRPGLTNAEQMQPGALFTDSGVFAGYSNTESAGAMPEITFREAERRNRESAGASEVEVQGAFKGGTGAESGLDPAEAARW